jgi:hypothetical protein
MVTGDPKRTPSLVLFGNQDFWLSSGKTSCGSSCFTETAGTDAWNHGDVSPQINTTWLGLAGPGVAHLGVDNALWSDHTNIQPTMMALLGLHDDYAPDGRVLGEIFTPAALPAGMRPDRPALLALGRVYTQIEAPVGAFGLDTLKASTGALASHSGGDTTYSRIEQKLQRLGAERDALGNRMRSLLLAAAFDGQPVDRGVAAGLIRQGERLIGQASVLAR